MYSTASSALHTPADDRGTARGRLPADQELIARVIHRDEAALGAIYDRYHRLLYGVALRITGDRGVAEEVIQDVFHIVWQAAGGFHPGGSLAAWLIGIVRHRAIDATRSRTYRARAREHLLDDMQAATLLRRSDDQSDHHIMCETVRAALAELSAAQRQVLDLAYYGGLTQAEIAARIGVPLGTVKSRLRLGLAHLRRRLATLDL